MASRFTALPLRSGESFVLETDVDGNRKVVLVDGGQSTIEEPDKNELYQALRKHCPDVKTIDIAICTHRDHDHAGGFPAFVKIWLSEGHDIGEFWLPGAWSAAVEDLLVNPDRTVQLLFQGAQAAADAMPETRDHEIRALAGSHDVDDLRTIAELLRQQHRALSPQDGSESRYLLGQPLRQGHLLEDGGPDGRMVSAAASWGFSPEEWRRIGEDLESSSIHETPLSARLGGRAVMYWSRLDIGSDPLAQTLAANAIDTAEAIRAIASAAVSFDIPVRWFDFERFEAKNPPEGGYPGFLVPLNAVEVEARRRETDGLRLFLSLALTEQNVASLVFQRVETKDEPGVIFVADSRLAFGLAKPEEDFPNHLQKVTRSIVYTAAHHGSRNNDNAYKVLSGWLGRLYPGSIAVRNGGVWNQKLDGYLDVAKRRCAQCRQCHEKGWSQLVHINTKGTSWFWPSDQGGVCGTPKAKRKLSSAGLVPGAPVAAVLPSAAKPKRSTRRTNTK